DFQPLGPAARLTSGADPKTFAAPGPGGRLAYSVIRSTFDVWSIPLDPSGRAAGDPVKLTSLGTQNRLPSLDAAAKRMVFVTNRTGLADVFVTDLGADNGTALTSFRRIQHRPLLAASGEQVAYSSIDGRTCEVAVISAATRLPAKRHETCAGLWDWSPDRASLLLFSPKSNLLQVVGLLDLNTGRRTDVLSHPKEGIFSARFAPDGRTIAFTSGATLGDARVYTAPFRGGVVRPAEWTRITGEPASNPAWGPGRIYYRSRRDGFDCVWSQRLPSGEPEPVVHFHTLARGLYGLRETDFSMSVTGARLVLNLASHAGTVFTTTRRE
ncbi:MAG: TolB family protein, partial [Bryobacteraceae bacterium]